MTYRRAMDSAVAGSRGASQPAADRFPTPGTSRSASGAPLVQHPLERRQARDGGWYTMEDFMQYYGSSVHAGWYYWERAVRKVVPPAAAQPASSERAQRTALDATAATSHAEDRDFPDATMNSGAGPVMKCSPCPLCGRRCTGHTRRRITAGLVDAYCTHGLPRMGVHEWTTMWKQSHSSDAESGSAPIGAASEEPSRMETEDARELLVALNFEDEAAPGEAAAPGSASCLAGAALVLEDQRPAAAGSAGAIALVSTRLCSACEHRAPGSASACASAVPVCSRCY